MLSFFKISTASVSAFPIIVVLIVVLHTRPAEAIVCTNVTDCSSRARLVTGNTPSCTCTCLTGYTGTTCNSCAVGYTGYPNCFDECTNADASCNGNAISVGGSPPNCQCTCKTGFAGDRCNICASGYLGATCLPDDCTSLAVSCNGNAWNVYGTPTKCTCDCNTGYAGLRCESCAVGYVGYPTCIDACIDVNASCFGKGLTVAATATPGQCQCTCRRGYASIGNCGFCDSGFTNYPNCTDDCSDRYISCNGNGVPSGTYLIGCSCACDTGFIGTYCDRCDNANDYWTYPSCQKNDCTSNEGTCYGNAYAFDPPTCTCFCKTQFTGSRCERCASGYSGWPNCVDDCTNPSVSCSGRGATVWKGQDGSCKCLCQTGYAGSVCATCDAGFIPGLSNDCIDNCSMVEKSCRQGAASVAPTGTAGVCTCTCRPNFMGSLCQLCQPGFGGFPLCLDFCSSTSVSCSSRGTSVTGVAAPNCSCACFQGWGGANCSVCAVGYTNSSEGPCTSCISNYLNASGVCLESCASDAITCNGKGTVSGAPGQCSCACTVGYNGTRCERCSLGYNGFPNCVLETCSTPSVSCGPYGLSVSGASPNCICTCQVGYSGAFCNSCAVGYFGFPTCVPGCSVALNCSNRAIAVSGAFPNCTCQCSRGYTGGNCSLCAAGYTGFPNCMDECSLVSVSCSGRGLSVSGIPGKCVCVCNEGYSGTGCDRCAFGYSGFPTCGPDSCTANTLQFSCNGRGLNLTGSPNNCTCECIRGWAPPRCVTCASGFIGPDCADLCVNPQTSCSGNGVAIVSRTPSCICQCKYGYTGNQCDRCASGFVGYPNCIDNCTSVAVTCNGNAFQVRGTPGSCICNCSNGFAGANCSQCATGFGGYPVCAKDDCTTNAGSCNGRATSFSGITGNCSCNCSAGYNGTKCERCASGYSPQFQNFVMNCIEDCTNTTVSCNGRGVSATQLTNGSCSCVCQRGYAGRVCDVCIAGFLGYPNCVDQCQVVTSSCLNDARTVIGTPGACTCECKTGYQGSRCQYCAAGYSGYPSCYEDCTDIGVSCSGHAVQVVFSQPSCNCTCAFGWTGARCASCSLGFQPPSCLPCAPGFQPPLCDRCSLGYAGPTCSQCGTGFTGLTCSTCRNGFSGSLCREDCTNNTVSCNNFGNALWDSLNQNCSCTCIAGYTGARCEQCISTYIGWPNCVPNSCVSVNQSCNSKASAVLPNCTCTCWRGYGGPTCDRCATGFTGYPNCIEACTDLTVSCNNKASAVVPMNASSLSSGCRCTCLRGYTGPKCDLCSPGFSPYPLCIDECTNLLSSCGPYAVGLTGVIANCSCICRTGYGGAFCDRCSAGYLGYPNCQVDDCRNLTLSCNGNGLSVTGNGPSPCNCTCRTGYAGMNCNTCASGFSGYPNCRDACTNVNVSCNGFATQVSGTNSICACFCRQGYAGLRCEQCGLGYTGYPNCVDACLYPFISCNDHAFAVTTAGAGCACSCTAGFNGTTCDRCATGYGGYPNCQRDDCTTVQGSCEGNADSLSWDSVAGRCICVCKLQYAGSRCDRCASGYGGYPKCVDNCSDPLVSCGPYGASVTVLYGALCKCTCRTGYTGDSCMQCAVGFSGFPNCIDNCTNPKASCNNQGVSVSGPPGNCRCVCETNFAGSVCQFCATNYINPPFCFDNCLDLVRGCGPNAIGISYGEPNCQCQCKTGWTGAKCDSCALGWGGVNCSGCASNFQGTNCDKCVSGFMGSRCDQCLPGRTGTNCDQCLAGYIGAPNCVLACTNVSFSCSGNAWELLSSVPPCRCRCKLGFSGEQCERCTMGFGPPGVCNQCAAGFLTFPLCTDTCTNYFDGCNFHGSAIGADPITGICTCTCLAGYSGLRCDRCDSGYALYPNCKPDCTNVTKACGPNGLAVSGDVYAGCTCTCAAGWAGSKCAQCAVGFSGPNCIEACTNYQVSCNGKATNAYVPLSGVGCRCDCFLGFAGDRCESCASGYGGWPSCVTDTCTSNIVSCNNLAVAPVTGSNGACTCTCRVGVTGPTCNTCASGYYQWPQCYDDCTNNARSCSNRAISMQLLNNQCICYCQRNFTGPQCQYCNAGFTGPNCDIPTCTSIEGNCFGHATLLTGPNLDGSCACTCLSNWGGSTCSVCANGYKGPNCTDGCLDPLISCKNGKGLTVTGTFPNCVCSCVTGYTGLLCDRCDQGYGGYPNCTLSLCRDVRISCNGLASTVTGTPQVGCQCSCFPGYSGTTCGQCSTGYTGWPSCVPDCTILSTSCTIYATSVDRLSTGGCRCNCLRGYAGLRCEICSAGYFGYPTCRDDCTVAAVSCNGNGVAPSDASGTCVCSCNIGYTGNRCDSCAAGYLGYPTCRYDDCSTDASCNWRGKTGNGSPPNCACTCLPLYAGPRCETCGVGRKNYPVCEGDCTDIQTSCNGRGLRLFSNGSSCYCLCTEGYSGTFCEKCAAGYTGYPNCIPDCSSTVSTCNGFAYAVDGIPSIGCVCYCRPPYTGARCGQCMSGFGGYPDCLPDDCTSVIGSCNGRAVFVNGTFPFCNCFCRPEYRGSRCEQCQFGYMRDNVTGACVEDCLDSALSCNSKASMLTGTMGNCTCTCLPKFTGLRCERCAPGYSGYPNCTDDCTVVSVSCRPVALAVTGVPGNCQCTCPPRVGGALCQKCLDGYGQYPNCVDICTVPSISCNGKGLTVTGSYPNCYCPTCAEGFTGRLCDQCATGYVQYPQCLDRCSVSTTCNGNAIGFGGSVGNCTCACLPNYSGLRCDVCAYGYGPLNSNCPDACIDTRVSCGPNAVSNFKTSTSCLCTCKLGWSGAKCDVCALGFTGTLCDRCVLGRQGTNCQTCSFGYTGPDCTEDCTSVVVSCKGSALNVSGAFPNCFCRCSRGFAGSYCEKCDIGFAGWPQCVESCTNVNVSCSGHASFVAGADGACECLCLPRYNGTLCDTCARGFASYPACIPDCTVIGASCSSYATAVSGTPGNCSCTCLPRITGSRCDRCEPFYTGFPNCVDACNSTLISCSNRASNVSGPPGSCQCLCFTGYAGSKCERCRFGYSGWPNCQEDCSNVTLSCGTGAVAASNNTLPTLGRCNCSCGAGFRGFRCDTCSPEFSNFPTCNLCAAGYINYPACLDGCLFPNVSCSNRGTIDGDTSLPGACRCRCNVGFNPPQCSSCALGYTSYPNCVDACTESAVSCGGRGLLISPGQCACRCAFPFTGNLCDRCVDGYTNFPNCVPDCTVIAQSCNISYTLNVSGTPGSCLCHCAPRYSGPRCEDCDIGYSKFPTCVEDCTSVAVSCAPGAATAVGGTYPTCICTCLPRYRGYRCDQCVVGYENPPLCTDSCTDYGLSCAPSVSLNVSKGGDGLCDCTCNSSYVGIGGRRCDQCLPGYNGYPSCRDNCTNVGVSCNGNADSVAPSSNASACVCRCKKGYDGDRCERCAFGYRGYPVCYDACQYTSVSCNGIGLNVTGTPPICICSCPPGFTGPTCGYCEAGFAGWPSCVDNCSIPSRSCGEFSVAVFKPTTGVSSACVCSCATGYAGPKCNLCATGFSGYPNCAEQCNDIDVSCNGHASRVYQGNEGCVCKCLDNYRGDRCELCAPGYDFYPTCRDNCTDASISCGPFANSVVKEFSSNTTFVCRCACLPRYAGLRCDSCAPGYTGYPSCTDACVEVAVSCVGPATSVQGTPPNCLCSCRSGFAGSRCDQCATGYAGFPNCVDDCTTVEASCNSIGLSVTGTAPACQCTCPERFAGDRCEKCNQGYENWPRCSDECTIVNISCAGGESRATAVVKLQNASTDSTMTYTPSQCGCSCVVPFGGDRCAGCAKGYGSYPNCTEDCTDVKVSCRNGPASSVMLNNQSDVGGPGENSKCRCQCAAGYSGSLCDRCAKGYGGYPNCIDLCLDRFVSCGGVGTPIRNLTTAERSQSYLGAACECNCDSTKSNRFGNCLVCNSGYGQYPNCVEDCSDTVISCNSHATYVSGAIDVPCICTCTVGYAGTRCDRCDTGYISYPSCQLPTYSPQRGLIPTVEFIPYFSSSPSSLNPTNSSNGAAVLAAPDDAASNNQRLTLTAAELRSGTGLPTRSIGGVLAVFIGTLVVHNGAFAVGQAAMAACIGFTSSQTYPKGFTALKASLIQPQSFQSTASGDRLGLYLFLTADYDIPASETMSIQFQPSCFVNERQPGEDPAWSGISFSVDPSPSKPQLQVLASGISGAASPIGVLGSPAAAADVQSLLILGSMSCATAGQRQMQADLSWLLSPTAPLGGSSAVGRLGFAFLLVPWIAIFHLLLVGLGKLVASTYSWTQIMGKLRFPGLTLFAALFLHPGILLHIVRLFQQETLSPGEIIAGACISAYVLGFGVWLTYFTIRNPEKYRFIPSPFNKTRNVVAKFFLPSGDWTYTLPSLRHVILFNEFSEAGATTLSFWCISAVIIVTAFRPSNQQGCVVNCAVISALFFLQAVLIGFLRPYAAPVLTLLTVLSQLSLGVLTLSTSSRDETTIMYLGIVVSVLSGLRGLLQLLYIFVFGDHALCSSRRKPDENSRPGKSPTTQSGRRLSTPQLALEEPLLFTESLDTAAKPLPGAEHSLASSPVTRTAPEPIFALPTLPMAEPQGTTLRSVLDRNPLHEGMVSPTWNGPLSQVSQSTSRLQMGPAQGSDGGEAWNPLSTLWEDDEQGIPIPLMPKDDINDAVNGRPSAEHKSLHAEAANDRDPLEFDITDLLKPIQPIRSPNPTRPAASTVATVALSGSATNSPNNLSPLASLWLRNASEEQNSVERASAARARPQLGDTFSVRVPGSLSPQGQLQSQALAPTLTVAGTTQARPGAPQQHTPFVLNAQHIDALLDDDL